jgi:hypothetical protein
LSRSAEKESLLKNDGLLGYKTATSDTGLAEADEFLPVYESRESSPNLAPRMAPNPKNVSDTKYVELDKPMVIFTKPVIMNIMSYGILAL